MNKIKRMVVQIQITNGQWSESSLDFKNEIGTSEDIEKTIKFLTKRIMEYFGEIEQKTDEQKN